MKSSHSNARQLLSPPPLYVWAAAALAFAAIFLPSFIAFMDFRSNERPFIEASKRRIESFSGKASGDGMRAVAIGSSLFRRAILYDGKMEALAAARGLNGLEFLRLTRPDCELRDYAPLIDGLLSARPDVIIIESDTLFHIRRNTGLLMGYSDFLKQMLLKSLSSGRLVIPERQKYGPDRPEDPPVPEMELRISTEIRLKALRNRASADKDSIEGFLKKAASQGARIVLVDMQREPGFERLAGLGRQQTASLAGSLPEEYGVTLISYPGELGKEFFWDHAHLNEEGRTRFSRWLVDVLKGMDKRA